MPTLPPTPLNPFKKENHSLLITINVSFAWHFGCLWDFSKRSSLANLNVCAEERVAFSQTNMLSYVFHQPSSPYPEKYSSWHDEWWAANCFLFLFANYKQMSKNEWRQNKLKPPSQSNKSKHFDMTVGI